MNSIGFQGLPQMEKKSALTNDWEDIIAYWEEPNRIRALPKKHDLFQKQLGDLGAAQLPKYFAIFTLI